MGAGAEGGAEDKAKAEGEEDKAPAETELAVEVEAKVEAEAKTGAFRLKNIKMGTQSIFPNYFSILIFTGRWQQDELRLRYLRLIKKHECLKT
ncbi:MAG TPA: hypothetical protein DCW97_03795 [Acidobacteria bacterium]|nr:hypothetical protein [Acidobacteriota bacterium]